MNPSRIDFQIVAINHATSRPMTAKAAPNCQCVLFRWSISPNVTDGVAFTVKYVVEDVTIEHSSSKTLREGKASAYDGRDRDEIEINAIRKTVSKVLNQISR